MCFTNPNAHTVAGGYSGAFQDRGRPPPRRRRSELLQTGSNVVSRHPKRLSEAEQLHESLCEPTREPAPRTSWEIDMRAQQLVLGALLVSATRLWDWSSRERALAPEPFRELLATAMIGSGGGSITGDEATLVVPLGAFSQGMRLEIHRSSGMVSSAHMRTPYDSTEAVTGISLRLPPRDRSHR